jgi:hypothetical protein
MEDLLLALRNDGWDLLDAQAYPNGSHDPFKLEDDSIKWGIAHGPDAPLVELEFHAFGEMGERTQQLRDILYCKVVDTDQRLYFDKRDSREWRENLSAFVSSLNARKV